MHELKENSYVSKREYRWLFAIGAFVGVATIVALVFGVLDTTIGGSVAEATGRGKGKCELSIIKTVDTETAEPDDTITYRIEFENIGNADCTGGGVKIEDAVDPHLEFVSSTNSGNVTPGYGGDPLYVASERMLRFNAQTLTPGETGWVEWTARVISDEPCGAFTVKNIARITAKEYFTFTVWVESAVVQTSIDVPCDDDATITLIKIVKNDDGGTATTNDFKLFVGADEVLSGVAKTVAPGTYIASEVNISGYEAGDWSGDCDADGTITVDAGENAFCTIENNDIPPPPKTLACTLTTSAETVEAGDSTLLTWTSTGATSATLAPSIGSIPLNGSTTTTITTNTTYTGTFTRGTETVSCTATIRVTTEPSCIPAHITNEHLELTGRVGEPMSYVVTRDGTGTVTVVANNLPAGLSFDTATMTLSGTPANTGTFRVNLTASNDCGSEERELIVVVTNGGGGCTSCGGGSNPPVVVLFDKPTETPIASLSFVSLTQIPYTGIGSTVMTILFYIGLFLVSVALASLVLNRRFRVRLVSVIAPNAHNDVLPASTYASESAIARLGASYVPLPRVMGHSKAMWHTNNDHSASVPSESTEHASLEAIAERAQALVSKDALSLVAALGGAGAENLLSRVIAFVASRFPREDGWLSVNRERAESALSHLDVELTHAFATLLLSHSARELYEMTRTLSKGGKATGFLREIVTELDRVYRNHIEGASADPALISLFANVSDATLERLLEALSGGIDESYGSEALAVKLAVSRALDVIARA